MTNFDPLVERIALIEGAQDTAQSGAGAADHAEHAKGGNTGPSAAGAPPPEDLAEVEEFLTDALMGGIEWVYESRAAIAGPHWTLTEPETATIRKPAGRVVAKWAPKLVAFVPGFAIRFKDEVALCMVLIAITRGRVMIDRRLASVPAASPTPEGAVNAKTE